MGFRETFDTGRNGHNTDIKGLPELFVYCMTKKKTTSVSSDVTTHHMQGKKNTCKDLRLYNYLKHKRVLRTKAWVVKCKVLQRRQSGLEHGVDR